MKTLITLHVIVTAVVLLIVLPRTQPPPTTTYDGHLGTRDQFGTTSTPEDLAAHAASLGLPTEWRLSAGTPRPLADSLGNIRNRFTVRDGALHFFFVRDWFPNLHPWNRPAKGWNGNLEPGEEALLWKGPRERDQLRRWLGRKPVPQRLAALNTTTLELFDAVLLPEHWREIARIHSLTHLGLPNKAMQFEPGFTLPPNLKKLVVRNATLDDDFFAALNQLTSLEELVLTGCAIPYPEPRVYEWAFWHPRSWEDLPTPFGAVTGTLRNLTITRSDPVIFDYVIGTRWRALESVNLPTGCGFTAIVTLFGGSPDVDRGFPSLQSFRLELPQSTIDSDTGSLLRDYQQSARPSASKLHLVPRPPDT